MHPLQLGALSVRLVRLWVNPALHTIQSGPKQRFYFCDNFGKFWTMHFINAQNESTTTRLYFSATRAERIFCSTKFSCITL